MAAYPYLHGPEQNPAQQFEFRRHNPGFIWYKDESPYAGPKNHNTGQYLLLYAPNELKDFYLVFRMRQHQPST